MAQAVSRWLRIAEVRVRARSVRVGFVVDRVAQGQVFLRVLFSPVSIIPPLLHTHLSSPLEVCDSPEQAAHYHTLGPKLGATQLLAGTEKISIIYYNNWQVSFFLTNIFCI
jgi:hypothetical protein